MFESVRLTMKYFFDAAGFGYAANLFINQVDAAGAVRSVPQALAEAARLGRALASEVALPPAPERYVSALSFAQISMMRSVFVPQIPSSASKRTGVAIARAFIRYSMMWTLSSASFFHRLAYRSSKNGACGAKNSAPLRMAAQIDSGSLRSPPRAANFL
jgi:hypothetical protein